MKHMSIEQNAFQFGIRGINKPKLNARECIQADAKISVRMHKMDIVAPMDSVQIHTTEMAGLTNTVDEDITAEKTITTIDDMTIVVGMGFSLT